MRVRIDQISLLGTDRTVTFESGLNVITGPIASGKSTLLRLCRVLVGAGVEGMPQEVRKQVAAVSGKLQLGDESYDIVRPLNSSPSARIDVAGAAENLRLPFATPQPGYPIR